VRDHLADARAHELALVAERGQFRGGAFRFAQPRPRRAQLAFEPRDIVLPLRADGAQRVDHADQQADFFFEAINRLQVNGSTSAGHAGYSLRNTQAFGAPRSVAPCSADSAATITSTACCTSASVSVRSGLRKVKRTDRLICPSGTPFPV
jgi:hypothetical protein